MLTTLVPAASASSRNAATAGGRRPSPEGGSAQPANTVGGASGGSAPWRRMRVEHAMTHGRRLRSARPDTPHGPRGRSPRRARCEPHAFWLTPDTSCVGVRIVSAMYGDVMRRTNSSSFHD